MNQYEVHDKHGNKTVVSAENLGGVFLQLKEIPLAPMKVFKYVAVWELVYTHGESGRGVL